MSDGSLRIVLCTPAYAPALDYGGPVVKVHALATGLLALGHDVEVWTSDFGFGRTRVPAGRRVVDGVPVCYHRRLAAYRWTPLVPAAYNHGRRTAADVMHCFGLRDGLTVFAAFGFARGGRPYVVEPIGMHARRVRHLGLKRVVDGLAGDRYVRRASAVVATSELERDELAVAVPPSRLRVRLNPLQLRPRTARATERIAARRELGLPADGFVAGFVGRLSIKKGIDVLLDAAERTGGVDLLVSGPEEDEEAVAHLREAAAGALGGRLHVLPAAWGDDYRRMLSALDVFVLPSRTENFGNAAADAIAAGVPVVVTDRCGIASTVSSLDAGLVVPLDAGAIAIALTRLAADREELQRLGGKGDAIAALLDPRTVAAEQVRIYREVMA